MELYKKENKKIFDDEIFDDNNNDNNVLLKKYGLDKLPKEYLSAIKSINNELLGTGLIEFGNMLSFNDKDTQRLHSYYLNSIIQQNWIIIRQLNDICEILSNNSDSSNSSSNIKCQVCGKEIPYNKNGTCNDCHEIIMKRLENKNQK